ncbi:MFS transporter [Corynebacterium suedekumii]|nr:MFS transporter [Corynebacterium suedekumii]
MMTSMFLMVYMTEIAGLSAGVAGAIYGITKIWAGVADLIAGQTVDRFNTRWGRLRPWLLFGSTPLAIVFVLLFSTPAGLGTTATIAWIFLSTPPSSSPTPSSTSPTAPCPPR